MMCLPYGSSNGSRGKGWGGYAYVDHFLMVLNDSNCQRVSTMVHEFGHNLNLGHSGDYRTSSGSQQYADQIGFVSSILLMFTLIVFLPQKYVLFYSFLKFLTFIFFCFLNRWVIVILVMTLH